MNSVEGRLSHAKYQRAALLERDVGSASNERTGEAIGDGRQSAHGAWQNNHSIRRIAAAGDGRANVGVGVLHRFHRRRAKQLFEQTVAAAQSEFLDQHTQRVFRCHKMNVGHAFVGSRARSNSRPKIAPDAPVIARVRFI